MSPKSEVFTHRVQPSYTDARGDIIDIVEESVGHVGLVTFVKGAVRGNHYHKQSTQYTFILRGSIKFITTDIDGGKRVEAILEEGDCTVIPPGVVHTYIALTDDAAMLDMTTLTRRGEHDFERDTVRVNDRS